MPLRRRAEQDSGQHQAGFVACAPQPCSTVTFLCVTQPYLARENVYLDEQGSQLQVLAVVVLQGYSSETYGRNSPGVTCSIASDVSVSWHRTQGGLLQPPGSPRAAVGPEGCQ